MQPGAQPKVLAILLLMVANIHASVPHRVSYSYEDTVRVVLIWTQTGSQDVCPLVPEAGRAALNHVVTSLDTTNVTNVKVFPSASVSLPAVMNLWPGRKPHVIVHINASWASMSGPSLLSISQWAVRNCVGYVEIGSDAVYLTGTVFEWAYYSVGVGGNLPSPMYTAAWLDRPGDSLWMIVDPDRDVAIDSTQYPLLTGVIRNATFGVMEGSTKLYFKPFGLEDGRCEADPDSFVISAKVAHKLTLMGYQQAWNETLDSTDAIWMRNRAPVSQGLVGVPYQFVTITAYHDTVQVDAGTGVRNAVALSFEPQYLLNTEAASQIVYDAIMYASLSHIFLPSSANSRINPTSPTMTLRGPSLPQNCLRFEILDQAGRIVFSSSAQAAKSVQPPAIANPGVYFVRMYTNRGFQVRKMLVR